MVSKTNIQTDFFVPEELSEAQRRVLGNLIIRQIIENCNNGIDRNGKPFRKYDTDYVNSMDFQLADKSKNEVNLQQSGDMLASMEIVASKIGKITIGYPLSSSYAGQVEGNQLVNGRWFLGLPKQQLNLLISQVYSQTDTQTEIAKKTDNLVSKILGRLL